MVNGKPNLTFGGAAPVSDAKARQRKYVGGYNADNNFASLLPAEMGKQGRGAPSAQQARQPGQTAQGPAGIPTHRQPAPQASQPGQGMAFSNLPAAPQAAPGFFSNTHAFSAQGLAPSALPGGAMSRAQARTLAAPGGQGMLASSGGVQAQRMAKSSPRVSGTPITGRQDIGMVDTRKTKAAPSGKIAPARAANPVNIQTVQSPFSGAGAAPGNSAYNRYTAMFSNLGGLQSPQSFVSHGFAGQNAEAALKKLGYDVREARPINTYAQKIEPDPYALKDRPTPPAAKTTAAAKPGKQAARAQASVRNASETLPVGEYANRSLVPGMYASASQGLGTLAAKFESGSEGIAAIGYDRKGGTSYGKYQIASRVGTMDSFLSYLQDQAPDLAQRLKKAGPANTGGRSGRMPDEWRKIAAEDPQRFEKLQSEFIRTSHFEPAMQGIAEATGVAFEKLPTALQEVLFSTAVQHGPAGATRIISQAVQRIGAGKLQAAGDKKPAGAKKAEEQLITQIYNLRANQFVSSTSRVQSAVRNRLKQEMREAIQMLG